MTRQEAFEIVKSLTNSPNLIKHMLAVEAAMVELAKYFKEDQNLWGLAGLLHDADYQKYPDQHPRIIVDMLEKRGVDRQIIQSIESHAYGFNGMEKLPESRMDWALYTCDELTGFIVAVTLVRPEKKISEVTVENILSKWLKKDFAKGVSRSQVEMCEEKLGIKLPDFIGIVLDSMKKIANDLGL